MGTIIVVAIVALLFIASIVKMIADRKKGGCPGCGGCEKAALCDKKQDISKV